MEKRTSYSQLVQVKEYHRRGGSEVGNADKIFESTSKQQQMANAWSQIATKGKGTRFKCNVEVGIQHPLK